MKWSPIIFETAVDYHAYDRKSMQMLTEASKKLAEQMRQMTRDIANIRIEMAHQMKQLI